VYLAQPRPADNPQSFASGRLADPGTFTMDRVAFSLDGKEFYYTQSEACYSLKKAKTKVFKYDGHKWIGPTFLNEHHCGPTFSMDGKTLYFMGEKDNQVWMSRRTMKGWTIPALFLEKPYEHIDLMPTTKRDILSRQQFIGSTLDHVVGSALRFVFWKTRTLSASKTSKRGRHEEPNQLPL